MSFLDDLITEYESEIITIQRLTNSIVSDSVIAMALEKAYKTIMKYTCWDVFNIAYETALISLAISIINNDNVSYQGANGTKQLKSLTQGSRNETYESSIVSFNSDGLTEDVRSMLPYPRLKVF